MKNKTKIRIAAMMTALFIGGLVAGGIATRPASRIDSSAGTVAARQQDKVVQQTRTVTKRIRTPTSTPGEAAAAVAPVGESRPSVVSSPSEASANADESSRAEDEAEEHSVEEHSGESE
jgi:hypothetical protein